MLKSYLNFSICKLSANKAKALHKINKIIAVKTRHVAFSMFKHYIFVTHFKGYQAKICSQQK
jgi:hypothetical protein